MVSVIEFILQRKDKPSDPQPPKQDWRENPTLKKAFDIKTHLSDLLQTQGTVDTGTIWAQNDSGVYVVGKAKVLGVTVRAPDPNSPITAMFMYQGIQTSVSFPELPNLLPKITFTEPEIIQQARVEPILDALENAILANPKK